MSKTRFEEYVCKFLIEKLYPHLSLTKSEGPDWIEEKQSIGIECTTLQDMGFYTDDNGDEISNPGSYTVRKKTKDYIKKDGKAKKGIKAQLEKYGEFIDGIAYCQYPRLSNFLPSLEKELKDKLDKLNNLYTIKNENWLAFFAQDRVYSWHYEEYLQLLHSIQQSTEYKHTFDKILICGSNSVVFDIRNVRIEIQQEFNAETFEKIKLLYQTGEKWKK